MATANSKKPVRPKVPVPITDIEEEFRAQLGFLAKSCEAYDGGDRDEFRRIALAIRVLIYDNGASTSVSHQLGVKVQPFLAFSRPVDPTNLLSEMPLVIIQTGSSGVTYLPGLSENRPQPRLLPFEDWWNEEVFRSQGGVSMARSGFILHTANQAGGAHVDSELDEEFHKIAKSNEAGWMMFSGSPDNITSAKPIEDFEKACVRHIGFEVLQTLTPQWHRIQGNRICDCGSGRKFRYCHGKTN